MYFKDGTSMSPKVLENCNNFFYIINVFFIVVIFGYLIYDNGKNK